MSTRPLVAGALVSIWYCMGMDLLWAILIVLAPAVLMKLIIVWVKHRAKAGGFADVPTKGPFTSMFDMVGIKYRVPPES